MTVLINLELLEKHEACQAAVDWFMENFPNGISIDVSHNGYQIGILMNPATRKWLPWLWSEDILPMWKMSRISFRNANLEGVNLRNANLRFANFRNANLEGANLENVDLSFANLRYANLKNVDFQSANLESANLLSANLEGANLLFATLQGANLEGVIYNQYTVWDTGLNCNDAPPMNWPGG